LLTPAIRYTPQNPPRATIATLHTLKDMLVNVGDQVNQESLFSRGHFSKSMEMNTTLDSYIGGKHQETVRMG
jgi:hypothetical protein